MADVREEDVLALVQAGLESGFSFAEIGLSLREEYGFHAGEAIRWTRLALERLAAK